MVVIIICHQCLGFSPLLLSLPSLSLILLLIIVSDNGSGEALRKGIKGNE